MFVGAVVDYQVHEDVHIPFFGLGQEPVHVLHGAETGVDIIIIGDVVAFVRQRGGVAGGEPDDVHAQVLQVIQLADDAGKIADSVSVGITEALWVNLIRYLVMPPFFCHNDTSMLFLKFFRSLLTAFYGVPYLPGRPVRRQGVTFIAVL